MIKFERGEFSNGDTTGIVVPDFDEHSRDDLFLNPLAENCWIMTVFNFKSDVTLVKAFDLDFDFVPSQDEVGHDNYDMFWASELTVLCGSYEEALTFIRNYTGPYSGQITELHENLLNPIDDAEHE